MAERVLILGSEGMLGAAMAKTFKSDSRFETLGTQRSNSSGGNFFQAGHSNLDDLFSYFNPDVVINCLGVVKQSSNRSDIDRMTFVNGQFPIELAKKATNTNSRLFHISTDCVFSGNVGHYKESDIPDPIDLYGISKLLGEESVEFGAMVLRTSIIGHELTSKVSLIDWFLGQKNEVSGFSKAIFSGFPTSYIAELLATKILPMQNLTGLYHFSGDPIDKYSLLQLVSEIYGKNIQIYQDKSFVIDRSLDSSRLRKKIQYTPPSWPMLVEHMYKDYLKHYNF